MKKISIIFTLVFSLFFFAQTKIESPKIESNNSSQNHEIEAIKEFQKQLNEEYLNPEESPLRGDNFTNFKEHPFFPIDLKYKVIATLSRIENAEPFELPTSSGKTQPYKAFGKLTFSIDNQPYSLTVYQSLNLIKKEEFKNHLFLPFRDKTNSVETYGGGKYLDLEIPEGETVIIDFNQSYQPYSNHIIRRNLNTCNKPKYCIFKY